VKNAKPQALESKQNCQSSSKILKKGLIPERAAVGVRNFRRMDGNREDQNKVGQKSLKCGVGRQEMTTAKKNL